MTLNAADRARRIAERWDALFQRKLRFAKQLDVTGDRPLKIVIEGTGDWVTKAYRPALFRIAKEQKLLVTYAYNTAIEGVVAPQDDERWKKGPPKGTWEHFIDKKTDGALLRKDKFDAVFVVTPDKTHCTIAKEWLRLAPLIFVEKPFDVSPAAVEDLIRAHGNRDEMNVLGVDHYQLYATPLMSRLLKVVEVLGGGVAEVEFLMCENNGVEEGRSATLQMGLTFDLLCHLLALLLPFTDLDSLDGVTIHERARYRMPPDVEPFQAETFSRTSFSAGDCIDRDLRFPCKATVGKGLLKTIKYVRFRGLNGRFLVIDFLKRPKEAPPPAPGEYPLGAMFLVYAPGETENGNPVNDPYHPAEKLHIITSPEVFAPDGWTATNVELFDQLFLELARGGGVALSTTLLIRDAEPLVRFLDDLRNKMSLVSMTEYNFQTRDPMA